MNVGRLARFVALELVSISSVGGAVQSDWLVVPGERVGPVTAQTSFAALGDLFGAAQVGRKSIYLAEGFCAPGAVVFPGSPDELEILWQDSAFTAPAMVRVVAVGSRWKTPAGIGVGTTLEELERLNGGPFLFGGFGWDYGGGLTSFEGGRLADTHGGRIAFRLEENPSGNLELSRDPRYVEILGERAVRSDHPIARRAGIRISMMAVNFSSTFYPEEWEECR